MLHAGNRLIIRMVQQNYCIPTVKPKIKRLLQNMHQPLAAYEITDHGSTTIRKTYKVICPSASFICKGRRLFVCFSTRAIHLEVCSDLAMETFPAVLAIYVLDVAVFFIRLYPTMGKHFLARSWRKWLLRQLRTSRLLLGVYSIVCTLWAVGSSGEEF